MTMRTVLSRALGEKPKPSPSAHAGLWLDKYLLDFNDPSKKELIHQITEKIFPQKIYADFYSRWIGAVDNFSGDFEDSKSVLKPARVLGRLAINLGAESLIETSIALHRTYGVPYIPGSALKGLAAHYARNHLEGNDWEKGGPADVALFGAPTQAGCVIFFDALLVPNGKSIGLKPDVITVHHADYYRGEESPPADWDSPTPIPFLSIADEFGQPAPEFLVALSGPQKWVTAAFSILDLALKNEGVGAKTTLGYGRMELLNDLG